MAKLMRIVRNFLMKFRCSAVSVYTDSLAEKRNRKMSKRQLKEKVKELEQLLSDCKAWMFEAEKKHRKNLETIAQMESDKANLTNEVESLQETVQTMGKLLSETHKECDEILMQKEESLEDYEREREARISLQEEYDELMEMLMQQEESLKNYEREREERISLQVENDKLMELVMQQEELLKDCEQEREARISLQVEYDKLKEMLMQKEESLKDCEREREARISLQVENDKLMEMLMQKEESLKVCEREREARISLQTENDKLKELLIQKEESLKDSLAEEKEKHQRTADAIAQVESEKASLAKQVKSLRETLQAVGNQLAETHKECDDLRDDCNREREAGSSLQAENDKLKETLKDSQAKEKEKRHRTTKTIAWLKYQRGTMSSKVMRLQDTVQSMRNELAETHKECEKLRDDCKLEREARSSLQAKYEKKEMLMQKKEPRKVNRSVPKNPTPASRQLQPPSDAFRKPPPPRPTKKMESTQKRK